MVTPLIIFMIEAVCKIISQWILLLNNIITFDIIILIEDILCNPQQISTAY